MTTFIERTAKQRKERLQKAVDNTDCAIMLYYDENGEIRTCAAAAEGHEHNLLNLFAASADMARNAVDCSLT